MQSNRTTRSFLALLVSLGAAASLSRGQLIDSYNADTLTVGSSVSSLADLTGTQNANTINPSNDPTAANTNSAFNGHTYVNFGSDSGLETSSALFSGGANRSVVAVYDTPFGDNSTTNPIVGQAGATTQGTWFVLQARDQFGAIGSPYLAGFIDDVGSNTPPVANQLTFAIATYDGTTETLYWAYGLSGSVQSASSTASPALHTVSNPFTIGFDQGGESSSGDMQIGQVQVYANSLTGAQADALISNLQDYYTASVPEPATYALMLGGLAILGFCIHRKHDLFQV